MNSRVIMPGDTLAQFNLLDAIMPVMLAHIDRDQRYQYHNNAFREWLRLDADAIDGHTMAEVLGTTVYSQVERRVAQAMNGHTVRYERTQKAPGGGAIRLFVNLVPHFDPDGVVEGLFAIIILRESPFHQGAAGTARDRESQKSPSAARGDIDQALLLFEQNVTVGNKEWRNIADRIKHALNNDEFLLYSQVVQGLQSGAGSYFRVCLRIAEEEEGLMHPGTFMPLAEQHDMMRDLDRWTVTNLLKCLAAGGQPPGSGAGTAAYQVPLHRDVIADPYFPDFLENELAMYKVSGARLIFELQTGDVRVNLADAANLAKVVRRLGCGLVLASFGRDSRDVDVLKEVPADYVMIDSSIIYRMTRDGAALSTIRLINEIAHAAGVKTVAELVECEECVAKLKEIGVDYAQGLAVGAPALLRDFP